MSEPISAVLIKYSPLLLEGLKTTALLWVYSSAISLSVGMVGGMLTCNVLRSWWTPLVDFIFFSLRGTPFFVQLLIAYFILPEIVGVPLSAFWIGALCLGLCSSGYTCQMMRGQLNIIPMGHWEAASVLGFSPAQSFFQVILPQALANAVPSIVAELEHVVKSTAVISSIGVLEITRAGQNIIAYDLRPLPIYGIVAASFLCFSIIFSFTFRFLERKGWSSIQP